MQHISEVRKEHAPVKEKTCYSSLEKLIEFLVYAMKIAVAISMLAKKEQPVKTSQVQVIEVTQCVVLITRQSK